jgi:hypothetical protein
MLPVVDGGGSTAVMGDVIARIADVPAGCHRLQRRRRHSNSRRLADAPETLALPTVPIEGAAALSMARSIMADILELLDDRPPRRLPN